jgi:alkanesulfonate monooxygenase SsuD/methylene tetrahydromethanopterin reductase-like flavin-dependent oxidoreductase (luciferase family)
VAVLGEYVAAVRALLGTRGDESVCFDGEHFRYCVPPFRVATALPPPPVWTGGAGPATVRLATDVADGLAGHLLWTYSHIRNEVRLVVQARALRSRWHGCSSHPTPPTPPVWWRMNKRSRTWSLPGTGPTG